VPSVWREIQNIARRNNSLIFSDNKFDLALHHKRHLFVMMTMGGRNQIWNDPKSANHDLFANNHSPFNSFLWMLDENFAPIRN
jgi:hypothetical protein